MIYSTARTVADASCPVLLVSAERARVDAVRQALGGWPGPTSLTVVAHAMPALRLALSQPLQLAIVDWALQGQGGRALVRQLARLQPELRVLAFDRHTVRGSANQVMAWPWDELAQVLDHRQLQLPADGPCARGGAPS